MKLGVKEWLSKASAEFSKSYTKTISVTFSNGLATITENGVTTSTRILVTRRQNLQSSLSITAKVTANNTIGLGCYNCQGSGSNYSGTIDVTLFIDNR